MKKYAAIAAILIFSMVRPSFCAVSIHPDAGTTAAAFLKLGAGARASSMAGAFTSIADDATAVYWNPAGLMSVPRREVVAAHNESFEGIRHDYVGYVGGLKGKYRWGAAFYGLYTPADIERRGGLNEDDPFEPLSPVEGYFAAYDAALSVAAARRFGAKLSAGAAVKVINQTIDDRTGRAVASDIGVLYEYSDEISLAGTIKNAGTSLAVGEKSYPLPLSANLGAAWSKKFPSSGFLRSAVEISFPNDNYPSLRAGAEYFPVEMFAVRAGYRYRFNGPELDDLSGLAVGAGVKISDLRLDYSFNPYGALGNSHKITLSAVFGPRIAGVDEKIAPRGEPSASGSAPRTIPRIDVALPRGGPLPAAESRTPPDSEFSSSTIIFTPGIVSATGVTGSIFSEPSRDGIKSFRASISARGVFSGAALRTAVRRAPDDSSSEYYFRMDAPGRLSDVTVVIETSGKIKSARALMPPSAVGVPPKVSVVEAPRQAASAGGTSNGRFVYEIKSEQPVDFQAVYE
jgi:hypothetical protein